MKRLVSPVTFEVITLLLLAHSPAGAQTSYPMLMSLKPVAAQAGQTSEHELQARYDLHGAYEVLVTGEGVTGEVIVPGEDEDAKKTNRQKIRVRFTVDPDAQPGVRDFRVATPRGVSTLGQLVIVSDPVIRESGKNDAPDQAQEISLPATVCGTIERNEDVDYFKFRVESGTSLNFHVRSMRLQNKIHDLQRHSDPILTLRNQAGTTLAASDNEFFGDPFLHYHFKHGGEYWLEIRDVRYQGNPYWDYSIEINDRPFVTQVFPLAVAPGQEATLQLVGFQLPADREPLTFTAPKDSRPGTHHWSLPLGENLTSLIPLIVSDLPLVPETSESHDQPGEGQPIAIPCGINGRMDGPGDIDYYTFAAEKGETFTFEVLARRRQSALDSHLRILDAQGKQRALEDDLRIASRQYADSRIENWTAPADGTYTLEIRDLHLRGGGQYVYFVEATRSRPDFELFADTDKTQLTPGTNGVIFVRAMRKNGFQGEIQLHVDGLPEGVTARCGRILAGKGQDGCIILQAAPDAPMSVADVTITGTATHDTDGGEPVTLQAQAVPQQEIYLPGGGRGHWPVATHSVSVGAASDIRSVTLSTDSVVLQAGKSQRIDVTIERAPGFDKNVTLDVRFQHLSRVYGNSLPPGVAVDEAQSKTLLTGTETQGYITLKAQDQAEPVDRQQISVMANISINFVMKATYSSPPVYVTVEQN